MAAPRWLPTTAQGNPVRHLVDPSDEPEEYTSLWSQLIEYCKRLGKDSTLDFLICQQLVALSEKEVAATLKRLSRVSFTWPGQLVCKKPPKLRGLDAVVYHHDFPLYMGLTWQSSISCPTNVVIAQHYRNRSADALPILSGMQSVVTRSSKHTVWACFSINRPGAHLLTLHLLEVYALDKSASRFYATLIDLSNTNPEMTPSLYYAKYRSKRSGSPSSVPASSTELQLPSRTTSKLICENRELARPESRVRTVGAHSLQYSIHETMLSYKFVQYGYYQRRYLAKLLMPDLQAENTEAWRNELDLLSKLQHPSLCPPIGAAPMHLSEFIQYDAFGPLYESVLALDESIGLSSEIFTEIFQALFVVADGLEFLHRQNITHGRLYSGSIVRNPNGDIFLLDYTTPKRIPVNWHSKQDKSVIELFEMFQAPEMSGQTSFVPSADVYSFGVLLWRFFHRKLPKLSIEELENGIKLPCDDVLGFQSCQIDTLFEACTDLDPTKRPNMTEVIQFLHAIWTEARAKYGWTQPQALEFKPSVVTLSEHLPKAVYLNQWALGPNVYEKY